jgi:hypothetical protein
MSAYAPARSPGSLYRRLNESLDMTSSGASFPRTPSPTGGPGQRVPRCRFGSQEPVDPRNHSAARRLLRSAPHPLHVTVERRRRTAPKGPFPGSTVPFRVCGCRNGSGAVYCAGRPPRATATRSDSAKGRVMRPTRPRRGRRRRCGPREAHPAATGARQRPVDVGSGQPIPDDGSDAADLDAPSSVAGLHRSGESHVLRL